MRLPPLHRSRILQAQDPSVAEVQSALKKQYQSDELIPKYLTRLSQKLRA
jgi:hypothetical protein